MGMRPPFFEKGGAKKLMGEKNNGDVLDTQRDIRIKKGLSHLDAEVVIWFA